METNLDDIDGVAIGHCFGLLLDAGALDVWATPGGDEEESPRLHALGPGRAGLAGGGCLPQHPVQPDQHVRHPPGQADADQAGPPANLGGDALRPDPL